MKLLSFHVRKFRNIVDSGEVTVDADVTCLVGKNEAGKSGLLEALYMLNPAYGEEFNVRDQYPRWLAAKDRRAGDLEEVSPIAATFALSEDDRFAVENVLGKGILTGNRLTIHKKYSGNSTWSFGWNEGAAVQNLVADMPAGVQEQLADVKKLEELKTKLKELPSHDDGPTADELAQAQQAIQDRGLHDTGVWHRIVGILKDQLPRFFRFTSYSTLPGRIDFDEIRGHKGRPGEDALQTARALLKLAGTDLDQLGDDDYEDRKAELEAVSIDLTNQVFEYWKQNPHLKVSIDVDKATVTRPNGRSAVAQFLDIRLQDSRTGYSNNFKQRSSGFQWFFSFLAAFSEFEGKSAPIILLDEPALTLHGRAQGDFLRFINDRLAPVAPVLYTTHSPFMIEPDRLERVRIVEDKGPPEGATVNTEVMAADADSLFPLQAALGYDIAQNLFVGANTLLVEGTSDYIYLTVMSRLCQQTERASLDERWRVLPAGGATNIPTFVSLIGPHLDVTVLADADTKGMQRVTGMVERKLLSSVRLIFANVAGATDNADIEDLFSEGDYVALYNKTYGTNLKVKDLPKGDRVVKRIESKLKPFVHGEVAETLLRQHQEMKFSDTTLDRFAALISAINETLET
ncbi:MAG: AAA family ATPase [Phycisphaerales bacterium]